MFYVRIVLYTSKEYDFKIEDETTLFSSDEAICKLNIDRRFEYLRIIVTYGGFTKREIAEQEGKILFYNLKKQFIRIGIPINISGGLGVLDTTQTSFDTGGLTEYGLNNISLIFPQLKDVTVRSEKLGMQIYELGEDISNVKFIVEEVSSVRTMNSFPKLNSEIYNENYKINVAYSLLNSGNAINDLRANFLLKVSAIESLVSEDSYKDKNYCDILNKINKFITVDNLKDQLEISEIELDKMLQKIKSAVGNLKKKSIAEKCVDLIESCDIQKKYLNKDAISFFNACYRIRSEFVHTGEYKKNSTEEQKIRELEEHLIELNTLVFDILDYYEEYLVKV